MKVETEGQPANPASTNPAAHFKTPGNYAFVRHYMGVPVFVTLDEGKFAAKLPGREPIHRAALKEVEKEIEKTGKPVQVMVARMKPGYPYMTYTRNKEIDVLTIIEASLTGASNRGSYYHKAEPSWRTRGEDGEIRVFEPDTQAVYLYNEAVATEFEAIVASEEKRAGEIMKRAKAELEAISTESHNRLSALLERADPLTKKDFREAQKA